MISQLNKIFVYVPALKVEEFKTGAGLTNAYKGKISFLSGTGEIMTNGEIFALNKSSEIDSLKSLVGSTLVGTGADTLQVSTVIDFIQEVYEITMANSEAIGDSESGLTKSLNDLKVRVGMTNATGLSKRISDAESAITILNKTDGTVGSVKKTVDDAIASIVASAPEAFDTLKEIADWISTAGEAGTTAATMLNDINTLKIKVGEEGTPAIYYTQEEANAYNTEHNLEPGDPDYKTTESVKTPAVASTGIYSEIDDLQSQIDILNSGGTIDEKIGALDSSLTLAGTTSSQPVSVDKETSIDVLGSVTISESNGKLDAEAVGKSAKVILQADAAGAAKNAYDTLLGTAQDTKTKNTIYGVKAYIDDLVDVELWEEYTTPTEP